MQKSEYITTLSNLYTDNPDSNTDADRLLNTLAKAESLLFDGKEEIQPVKWHQVKRIYNLAVTCIQIVRIIWPYLKMIISLLKK